MSKLLKGDEQEYYSCGQCGSKIFNLIGEAPTVPCPDCGWYHKAKRKYDMPSEIKIDLSQY